MFQRRSAGSGEGLSDQPDAGLAQEPAREAPASLYGDSGLSAYTDDEQQLNEEQVALPLLGRAPAAQQQRRLLIMLAVGVTVLALMAGWVLQQAERSAQQLAANGQALMQSQRLAK
ncbi:MAG: methyl-accepting chemotaxis protein, partial [Comamonas sp.]